LPLIPLRSQNSKQAGALGLGTSRVQKAGHFSHHVALIHAIFEIWGAGRVNGGFCANPFRPGPGLAKKNRGHKGRDGGLDFVGGSKRKRGPQAAIGRIGHAIYRIQPAEGGTSSGRFPPVASISFVGEIQKTGGARIRGGCGPKGPSPPPGPVVSVARGHANPRS